MFILSRIVVVLAGAIWVSAVSIPRADLDVDVLNAQALAILQDQENNELVGRETDLDKHRCTLRNAVRRRDW
jgi:hypothetical protein